MSGGLARYRHECVFNVDFSRFRAAGQKYEKAKEWKVSVVNIQWLNDIMFGQLEALKSPVHARYQQFNTLDEFRIENWKVAHLLGESSREKGQSYWNNINDTFLLFDYMGCKTLFSEWGKLSLKLTCPACTSPCPATLLNKGEIGLCPKHYLLSRASQGLVQLAPLPFFLPNSFSTCNGASGYVAR